MLRLPILCVMHPASGMYPPSYVFLPYTDILPSIWSIPTFVLNFSRHTHVYVYSFKQLIHLLRFAGSRGITSVPITMRDCHSLTCGMIVVITFVACLVFPPPKAMARSLCEGRCESDDLISLKHYWNTQGRQGGKLVDKRILIP